MNNHNEGNNDKCYILITQCLQNDFFINKECRLCLPDDEVERMLGKKDDSKKPLEFFLKNLIGGKDDNIKRNVSLHVINIRDCHYPGPSYDQERQEYGRHCESDTKGFEYIKGLEVYLNVEERRKKVLRMIK